MAKKSAIEKNRRRQKLVDKYSAKREQLKKAAVDESLPQEDRRAAEEVIREAPRIS